MHDFSAFQETKMHEKIGSLVKNNKMRQTRKTSLLKMQRPERKKKVTVTPQAGEVISKNIFHQEGERNQEKKRTIK